MEFIILAVTVILAVIAFTIFSGYRNNKKLRLIIEANYGQTQHRKYKDYELDSISEYWEEKKETIDTTFTIDETTWHDLDMDEVFKKVNNTSSSIGEEYLYSMLHQEVFDTDKLNAFEKTVQYFENNAEARTKIQLNLAKVGKVPANGLPAFLFRPEAKRLKFSFIYPILGCCALLSIILAIVNPQAGVQLLVVIFATNSIIYYKTKSNLEDELISMRYIAVLMNSLKKITKIKTSDPVDKYIDRLSKLYAVNRRVSRAGMVLGKGSTDIDFLLDYIKIIFMLDFVVYNSVISAIINYNKEFNEIYEILGLLDSAISVASYRKSLDYYVIPEFTYSQKIEIEELYHPLLDNPVPNSVVFDKSSLITGSNAAGKSTFVKAVAVNSIFAHTIHTCLARKFELMPSHTITSMAISDNLGTGESYYIAEIKSLRRVIDTLNDKIRCLCFVDEILKGTNTIERIAASSSILKYMKDKNCFMLVATHDIELTEITKGLYDNYHFRERITDTGIEFDYKINEGWATTKNAIKLLEFMEYDDKITQLANNMAKGFEETRAWTRLNM
jgi:Mismatch repair ATPase (MutS family)